jgi:hypothetical protein
MVWKFSGLIAENYLRRPGRPVKAHRQLCDFPGTRGAGKWPKIIGTKRQAVHLTFAAALNPYTENRHECETISFDGLGDFSGLVRQPCQYHQHPDLEL